MVMQMGVLQTLLKITGYSYELHQHQKNDGSVIERYCLQTGMLALSMMCEKQWGFLYRSETIFLKGRSRKA